MIRSPWCLGLCACALVACTNETVPPNDGKAGSAGSGGGMAADCEGRGENYFAGMKKTSADGTISVELVAADPAPPANSDRNVWTTKVTTASDAPIEGATIIGSPWMIDHGHGAANPLATDLGGGRYSLGPLALTMTGLWQVTVKVTPAGQTKETDVVFTFCIPAK
jgi:YtkA-like